jgi:hypothetical protein
MINITSSEENGIKQHVYDGEERQNTRLSIGNIRATNNLGNSEGELSKGSDAPHYAGRMSGVRFYKNVFTI